MFEKPLGGTELMFNELVKRVPKDLFDKYKYECNIYRGKIR